MSIVDFSLSNTYINVYRNYFLLVIFVRKTKKHSEYKRKYKEEQKYKCFLPLSFAAHDRYYIYIR